LAPNKSYSFVGKDNASYKFFVYVENQDGYASQKSDPVDFSFFSSSAPGAPVLSYTLNKAKDKVSFTWTTPADGGRPIDHYTLRQSQPGSTDYRVTGNKYDDLPVTYGQTYLNYHRVAQRIVINL
jgi:hypothetical protein